MFISQVGIDRIIHSISYLRRFIIIIIIIFSIVIIINIKGEDEASVDKAAKMIEDILSPDEDKINEHKKQFEYQHKYKYRNKLDSTNSNNDIRTDRIEFYKKEQQKNEESKQKINDILLNLIDSGVISENLDSINYDKINIDELEKKLKQEFGEDEFNKLMLDIKK